MIKCYVCRDLGVVRRKVELNHPDFAKTYPCPAKCDAAQQLESDRLARSMKMMLRYHENLDAEKLQDYSLADFMVSGKWLAAVMAELWSDGLGGFSVADAMQLAGKNHNGLSTKPKHSLIFRGDVGTGKTTIAALAGCKVNKRGDRCLMVRFDELYSMVKETFKNDSKLSEDEVLKAVCKVPFLILDEIMESPRDYMRQVLFHIVDYRFNHQMPTIYITNLTADEIKQFWGERIADRMLTSHLVLVDGQRYRVESELLVAS